MKKSINIQKSYDHPISSVWQALTDKDALSEWLMPCDFKPEVGHKFQFTTKPQGNFDGIVHCKVLTLIENKELSISWKSGSLDTVVTFLLSEENGRTNLIFSQTGFEGIMNRLVFRNVLARGWNRTILTSKLNNYLSK